MADELSDADRRAQAFFWTIPHLDENKLYKCSLVIEPKGEATMEAAKILQQWAAEL